MGSTSTLYLLDRDNIIDRSFEPSLVTEISFPMTFISFQIIMSHFGDFVGTVLCDQITMVALRHIMAVCL
jgi:hypothetical protein